MIKKLELFFRQENLIAGIIFVIALGVYHTTMCPTVSFTDSGELATVATTLGIAHPTGYPLWTLIGRLAVMIPFGDQEIVRLNTLASILTALAVGLFFKLLLVLHRSQRIFKFKLEKSQDRRPWIPAFGAFITALTVGFSSTIWAQSVEIEVYALHAVLVIITVIAFVSGIEDQLSNPHLISRGLLLFSFVLGLSFANHMTTVLLAPGFLYLFFVSLGLNKRSWQLVFVFIPFFLLGLTAYIYLPTRSVSGPLMDWGHPVTLERFWWHVTGKQYQIWMFSGIGVATKQFQYFLTNFPTEFRWPIILILFVGLLEAFNLSKRFLMFVGLLFVTCIAYAVNYDIHDVDSYFLLAYIACGCILALGMRGFLQLISKWNVKYSFPFGLVLLISLPVVQGSCNRIDVDQSKNVLVAHFVNEAYSHLDTNAIVFASTWDYFVSPSYYYQVVRKQRADVIIVDLELLKNRTWYFTQLDRQYAGFLKGSEDKVSAFLAELRKFEKGEVFDFRLINRCWNDLLDALVTKALRTRAVYIDPRITDDFSPKFNRVPQGLFLRLAEDGKTTEWKPLASSFAEGTFHNEVTSDLRRYYASMYTYHSYWLLTKKRLLEALDNLQKALSVDPTYSPALNLMAQLSG